MGFFKVVVALSVVVLRANAYCPNGCTGHGSCGINGKIRAMFVYKKVEGRISALALNKLSHMKIEHVFINTFASLISTLSPCAQI